MNCPYCQKELTTHRWLEPGNLWPVVGAICDTPGCPGNLIEAAQISKPLASESVKAEDSQTGEEEMKEREADEDIARGRVKEFESVEELIKDLRSQEPHD